MDDSVSQNEMSRGVMSQGVMSRNRLSQNMSFVLRYVIFVHHIYRQDCFCLEICQSVTRCDISKQIVSRPDVSKCNVMRTVCLETKCVNKTETVSKFYINVTWILDPPVVCVNSKYTEFASKISRKIFKIFPKILLSLSDKHYKWKTILIFLEAMILQGYLSTLEGMSLTVPYALSSYTNMDTTLE
jgi:hypothetical protein